MKKLAIAALAFLIAIILYLNFNKIYRMYIQTFKKTMLIKPLNKTGQIDGEEVGYIAGKIYFSAEFKNGEKDGLFIQYFDSGSLKAVSHYKKGKKDGVEKYYYENGILESTQLWKNGYNFGSAYHYSKESKIINYDASDIKNADIIFYAEYDSTGKITQKFANVFSKNLYSKSKNSSAEIILKNNNDYANIKDLFLTVPTPPYLTSQIYISINKNRYQNLNVKRNTLVVANAFPTIGNYKISVLGKLLYKDGSIFHADTVNLEIKIKPAVRFL